MQNNFQDGNRREMIKIKNTGWLAWICPRRKEVDAEDHYREKLKKV
jgi:hypothetical protein